MFIRDLLQPTPIGTRSPYQQALSMHKKTPGKYAGGNSVLTDELENKYKNNQPILNFPSFLKTAPKL